MRKLTSAMIATTLGFLLLCSCKPGITGLPSTTNVSSPTTTNAIVVDGTTQTVETQTSSEESSSVDLATTGQGVNLKVSFTKAEIVELFNAAANQVKRDKPGYVFTTKSNADEKNIILPENIPFRAAISKFIASAINKTSKDPVTIAKKANHNDFPVKGQSWGSKLEPSALKSATYVDKGDYYEIELKFKDEKLTSLPDISEQTAHGKAFSVLLDKEFQEAFGGFDANLLVVKVSVNIQKFEPEYKDSTIKCTVDKAGRMKTAVYYLNIISRVETGVNVNKQNHVLDIQLAYSVTDEYI
ncbi:MAG TPA: hypothetical protein VFD23_04440, partial [Clostridia bacterium]|nr:hypothetical protein [Clostridia bacterium]